MSFWVFEKGVEIMHNLRTRIFLIDKEWLIFIIDEKAILNYPMKRVATTKALYVISLWK